MIRNRLGRQIVFLPLILTFAWAMAHSFNASAASHQKTFRFNVSPSGYPPYLIVDQGAPSGIIWDVVSLIGERIGYEVIPKKVPRKRVDQMLLDGVIDGTSRAREWTDDPERFLFTDPIVPIEEVFFVRNDSEFEYETPQDLYSKTVVTHLGYNYPELQVHFDAGNIHRFDVPRDQDMFTFVLHSDRFDAAIADRLVGQWILKEQGLQEQFRVTSKGISDVGYRIMLNKNASAFAKAFNAELKTLRENGELNAILTRYR